MEETTMMKMETSHWWWFDSHHASRRSPWLQSTLGDLDKKTKAMLKLIEQDADSFAQRAEMYYKKRPELVGMVEDFYRTHRCLAERYDQLKSDSGSRLLTNLGSPFATKYRTEAFVSVTDQIFDSHSEISDPENCAKSEVDDPEYQEEVEVDQEIADVEENQDTRADYKIREVEVKVESAAMRPELMVLREELERLKQENKFQKDQLVQKDEEKREVIRQLSLAMEVMKLENIELRKIAARNSPKKKSCFQLENLKEMFLEKLFNGCAPKSQENGVVV